MKIYRCEYVSSLCPRACDSKIKSKSRSSSLINSDTNLFAFILAVSVRSFCLIFLHGNFNINSKVQMDIVSGFCFLCPLKNVFGNCFVRWKYVWAVDCKLVVKGVDSVLSFTVKSCFLEGPPAHRFSALKHFAPDDSVEDLLGVLQKHAQLVQGLWVPRSLLLFDDKATCLARDYVLLLFSKNLAVKSEQLLVEAKLKDHIKRIVNVFAVERPSFKDWKFKEHRDVSFIKEYPNIVKKQEQIWAAAEEQVTDVINRSRKVGPCKGVGTQKSGTAGKPLKAMNSDEGATGVQSRKPMSKESRQVLPKALQKIIQIHKVCRYGPYGVWNSFLTQIKI
ncbi:hypothetical protein Patl1_28895 [Pistacia atlantica]|uniref:Uncharacterized protein n=1 Tax=Pistacia atlantica TaxID=434234 RepID=A0ACC1BFE8_9ROSI|nr:hypothetical protein Patl1_28895 [Pistacia atlantica]